MCAVNGLKFLELGCRNRLVMLTGVSWIGEIVFLYD